MDSTSDRINVGCVNLPRFLAKALFLMQTSMALIWFCLEFHQKQLEVLHVQYFGVFMQQLSCTVVFMLPTI